MAERYYAQPKDVIHSVLAHLGHRRGEADNIDHKVRPEAALSRPSSEPISLRIRNIFNVQSSEPQLGRFICGL